MANTKPRVPPTTKPKQRFEVDEIHVQLVVRELDVSGQTIDKHMPKPLRFVNECTFREWAAQPFNFVDERDPTAD